MFAMLCFIFFFFFFFKQKTAYEIHERLVGSEMCIRDSVWCTYDVRMVSSHGGCIERLVLGQNSFWLGNCYDLLHSGMDFQWSLEAQGMPPDKVPPPVSGVLPREK